MTCQACDQTPVAPTLVTYTGTFTNDAGVVVDPPGTITVTWRAPDGTLTVFVYGVDAEVVKVSTGIYECGLELTSPGLWLVKFEGGGLVTDTGSITVLDPGF